jgi:hypothetical protein
MARNLRRYLADRLMRRWAREPDHDSCNLLAVVGTMTGVLGHAGRPGDLSPQVDAAPAGGGQ